MLCSLCVKWEVFNTTGLGCDLDSTFAEVIPFAGGALYHRECWLCFVRLWLLEGERVHTSHACHLCEGQTWAPLHSDLFLTHRCSKEETNTTQYHFPAHIPLWHRGQLANGWWRCPWKLQHPPNRDPSMCDCTASLFRDQMVAHCAPQLQVANGFLLARGRKTFTVWRVNLFLAISVYPSCFLREEINLQLILTLDLVT